MRNSNLFRAILVCLIVKLVVDLAFFIRLLLPGVEMPVRMTDIIKLGVDIALPLALVKHTRFAREATRMIYGLFVVTGIIVEKQRDRKTAESKYRISGQTIDGSSAETVVKITMAQRVVFVTVYAL